MTSLWAFLVAMPNIMTFLCSTHLNKISDLEKVQEIVDFGYSFFSYKARWNIWYNRYYSQRSHSFTSYSRRDFLLDLSPLDLIPTCRLDLLPLDLIPASHDKLIKWLKCQNCSMYWPMCRFPVTLNRITLCTFCLWKWMNASAEDPKNENNASHDSTNSQPKFTETSINSRSAARTRDTENGCATLGGESSAPGGWLGWH